MNTLSPGDWCSDACAKQVGTPAFQCTVWGGIRMRNSKCRLLRKGTAAGAWLVFVAFSFLCVFIFRKDKIKIKLTWNNSSHMCIPTLHIFLVMLTSCDFKEHCQFSRLQIHGVFNLNIGVANPSPKSNIFMIQFFLSTLHHGCGVVSWSSFPLCYWETKDTGWENILHG